jgi:hypothetical protein
VIKIKKKYIEISFVDFGYFKTGFNMTSAKN